MSFKWTTGLAALGALAMLPFSHAQVASEGMDDISAWGERYLSSSEPDFPSNLWTGSDNALLLTLLQSLETSELTTAERSLLRRVVLSPAQPVSGSQAEELLAERARLMLELGEAEAAAALAPRLEPGALGLEAEALAVDLDLASGRVASACARLVEPVSDSLYWLQLRAVCAVLRGNFSGAELAIEVASSRGLDDAWFLEAVFASAGDVPNPPPARYNSGLSIALSLEAGLDTTDLEIAETRPDLAAKIALRPDIALPLRVAFGERAFERGLISAADMRDLLEARFDEAEFAPESERDRTLAVLLDPLTPEETQVAALANHLQSMSDRRLVEFERTAGLFAKDLARREKSDVSRPYATVFARAAFANGNMEDADAWLDLAYGRDKIDDAPNFDELFVDVSDPESDPIILAEDAALAAALMASVEEADTPSAIDGAPLRLTGPDAATELEAEAVSGEDVTEAAPVELVADGEDAAAEDDIIEGAEPGLGADASDTEGFVTVEGVELPIDTDALLEDEMAGPLPDAFLEVQVDVLAELAANTADRSTRAALATELIQAAVTETEFNQAVTLLNLLPSFDLPLDAEARAFLIAQPIAGDTVDPHILAAIESATAEGAFAEAALMMLTQLRNDPQAVAATDLARFSTALQEMRAGDIAAALARESSGFWNVPLSDIMVE